MARHFPSLKQRFRCVQSWLQRSWAKNIPDAPFQFCTSSRRGARSELIDSLGRLHLELAETTRLAEPDFAQLTRSLSKLHKSTSGLSALIEQSLSAVLAKLEAIQMEGTGGAANQTLSNLRSNLQRVHTQVAALECTVRRIRDLQSQSANIRRIGSFLTACSLNFAVECARSSDTAQEFTAFCHDLRTLATTVAGAGTQFGEECAHIHGIQSRALKDLNVRVSAIEQLISPAETAISAASRETRDLVRMTRQTLDLAAGESTAITRHSHDALYHLQLGDIVRQKWEHVCEAIDMARSRAENMGNPGSKSQAIASEIYQILAIQSAQMERTREEIVTAHRQLSEAFVAISKHTQELARQAEALTSLQSEGRLAKSLFSTLESALKRLEAIQTQGCELREEAGNLESEARQATTRLGDQLQTVRRINADIHLQSLNAIIRTCHLGDEGHTLGVLAMHMHGTFQESNACVQEVIGTLKQVIDGSTNQLPGEIGVRPEFQTGDEACFYGAAGQIAELYEELHETAARAVTVAREQHEVLKDVQCRLGFLPELAAAISRHGESIASLQSRLGIDSTTALEPLAASSLGQSYTMESEREILRRITGRNQSSEIVSMPETTPAGDLDGIDFFDLPPAPETVEKHETAKVVTQSADEEKSPVSSANISAPSGELPDLGDNVELF